MSTQISPSPTLNNSFLNAKAQSSRRTPSYDMDRPNGFRKGSSTLPVVPENHGHIAIAATTSTDQLSIPAPAPSSSTAIAAAVNQRQSTRRTNSNSNGNTRSSASNLREMDKSLEMKMRRSSSSEKGKSKELSSTNSNQGLYGQEQVKRKRADWVIDLIETQKGAESWIADQRVILVLGDSTPASLAPILYDPAFSDTLLLVGSYQPLPAIEALLSPSHLMSSLPDQQIFPQVQPFSLSIESNDTDAHALTVLLAQATTLAQQYRSRSRRSSNISRPRADSFASSASNSPPSTPPMRKRVLSNFGMSASSSARSSMDSNLSTNDRQRSMSLYDNSNDLTPKAKNRFTSFGRDSIFGSIRRNSESSDNLNDLSSSATSSSSGALFDAIINFVPEMSNFKQDRALQDMLHQAVVITTGIMPCLTKKQNGRPSSSAEDKLSMPISLIHVLPRLMPAPLPSVIESFLLSLLPTFQLRCPREIFGSVVTTPVWLSPFTQPNSIKNDDNDDEDVSGAQVLLFGGIRCPYQVLQSSEEQFRPRAFLSNWSSCINMPGLIAESRNPSTRLNNHHERQLSSPPSILYNNSSESRTPPRSRSPSSPKTRNLPAANQSHKSSLPRSVSMPISPSSSISTNNGMNTNTTRRSKLHVSHTPPMMSEVDLPSTSSTPTSPIKETSNSNSPPTPDLDSSINSSCSSSIIVSNETESNDHSQNRNNEENVTIMNSSGSTELSNATSNNGKNVKRGLKHWFKREFKIG
ncbi:uncharacterized protein L201_005972 [Kwoniella dendrophila CBS 6074]|uniref:Uncharacterized protein n=1 Tax=Kwoniella dendrophila CBS 6074 TaxID=1295534 RepID=A0AAX4K2B7_9TREE